MKSSSHLNRNVLAAIRSSLDKDLREWDVQWKKHRSLYSLITCFWMDPVTRLTAEVSVWLCAGMQAKDKHRIIQAKVQKHLVGAYETTRSDTTSRTVHARTGSLSKWFRKRCTVSRQGYPVVICTQCQMNQTYILPVQCGSHVRSRSNCWLHQCRFDSYRPPSYQLFHRSA